MLLSYICEMNFFVVWRNMQFTAVSFGLWEAVISICDFFWHFIHKISEKQTIHNEEKKHYLLEMHVNFFDITVVLWACLKLSGTEAFILFSPTESEWSRKLQKRCRRNIWEEHIKYSTHTHRFNTLEWFQRTTTDC